MQKPSEDSKLRRKLRRVKTFESFERKTRIVSSYAEVKFQRRITGLI
jgi:hypothetical protein